MRKLFLFDVDQTLITSPSSGRFAQSIKNLFGIDITINKEIAGLTDPLIFELLLKDEGWNGAEIATNMPRLIKECEKIYLQTFQPGSVQLMPGVRELLKALEEKDELLGLATGNLETIAHRKLEDVDIDHFFKVGGYGNDPHQTRSEIVSAAIKKAGYENNKNDVYVIGDSPRDIEGARVAGVKHSVGVTNGFRDVSELINAGAEIVIEDFTNTAEIMGKLGYQDL